MNETILILTGMASLVLSVSGIAAILSTADTGVPDSAHSDGMSMDVEIVSVEDISATNCPEELTDERGKQLNGNITCYKTVDGSVALGEAGLDD